MTIVFILSFLFHFAIKKFKKIKSVLPPSVDVYCFHYVLLILLHDKHRMYFIPLTHTLCYRIVEQIDNEYITLLFSLTGSVLQSCKERRLGGRGWLGGWWGVVGVGRGGQEEHEVYFLSSLGEMSVLIALFQYTI